MRYFLIENYLTAVFLGIYVPALFHKENVLTMDFGKNNVNREHAYLSTKSV
ncbi:Uncharacterised protein [Staphylococcus aureus]|uniref:hypothetical protein n=1 Tax=Staphylococcus aureus TaxID=1280 RepID=UPI00020F2569|nr:hypothetical protein [Staphylococcus aureus]EGL93970.1 hypothetical protein SA21310_1543 [Staphylococcus aureus subsp. aureus 21310]CAC6689671.1 Uncharacterised protein [Staphylococcus aureus]CAC6969024.1 Uncharacterised protein [Staphylococcus aureus]CFO23679.1 Uncharacterised protein [Staphylococcus aureus]CPJ62898.1 Uncharacterised protein [Staphylococcus aureus]